MKNRRQNTEIHQSEKEYHAAYRQQHGQERREKWKEWAQQNQEHRQMYREKWKAEKRQDEEWLTETRRKSREKSTLERQLKPVEVQKRKAKYRETHREQLRINGREYQSQNAEQIGIRKRLWEKTLTGGTVRRLSRQRYLSRKHQASGYCTKEQWLGICQSHEWRCYLCNCQLTDRTVVIEHRTPLSRGGTNDLSNLAPSCALCNAKKHSKTEEEYRRQLQNEQCFTRE